MNRQNSLDPFHPQCSFNSVEIISTNASHIHTLTHIRRSIWHAYVGRKHSKLMCTHFHLYFHYSRTDLLFVNWFGYSLLLYSCYFHIIASLSEIPFVYSILSYPSLFNRAKTNAKNNMLCYFVLWQTHKRISIYTILFMVWGREGGMVAIRRGDVSSRNMFVKNLRRENVREGILVNLQMDF